MNRIKSGDEPSFKGGVLSWREGDVFDFTLTLEIFLQGRKIDDLTGYGIEAPFFDRAGRAVHTFDAAGDGTCRAVLSFTEEVSAKFKSGRYSFDVVLTGDGMRTTIAAACPAIVR